MRPTRTRRYRQPTNPWMAVGWVTLGAMLAVGALFFLFLLAILAA